MNRFRRLSHHAAHRTALTCTALVHGVRALAAAIEHLDRRAIALLLGLVHPVTARLTARLRRVVAANCGDALNRHLPCRDREPVQDRWTEGAPGRRDAG
ncbi:hypothetical protein ABT263_13835 [Kitasatospora sp. NPDC001603]|uniref:hypothetical protein n=1 Tax=Kitasatospora sp. NPDC001603 TaxID=3154388 RepID=UPI00332A3999